MRPVLMVVAYIFSHKPFQVSLVEDNNVIEQVSSAASHPSLRDTVLPRAAIRGTHRLASQLPDRRHHIAAKLRVAIKEQESVHRRVGPRFSHLLHDPGGRGVACHIEMQNLAPLMADNEEAVQETKGDRRHRESIAAMASR